MQHLTSSIAESAATVFVMGALKHFDNLNTSYVNLAALMRHLREQNFVGSIHVALSEYEAEVVLNGEGGATVSEIDPITRRASQTAGARERLLVHAREPGGTITVYEGKDATEVNLHDQTKSAHVQSDDEVPTTSVFESEFSPSTVPPEKDIDWADLLDAGGNLIGAVERAVQSLPADFDSNFRAARIELGDDYPFLDPTANGLWYENKTITLNDQPSGHAFISGLSECLRRVVNKLASEKEGKRFRESVAIELAVAARMRPNGMGEFNQQLDRIAGTRVL